MFHDLMLLKLQVMHGQHTEMLFHSHWAGADIVPLNGLRLVLVRAPLNPFRLGPRRSGTSWALGVACTPDEPAPATAWQAFSQLDCAHSRPLRWPCDVAP